MVGQIITLCKIYELSDERNWGKEGLEINNFDKVPQETFNKKIEVSN
jgi:hypothetical protein